MSENLYGSITVRLTFEALKFLDENAGRGKKFPDKSSTLRYYFERGQQFEALLEIYNNPEKRAEFESKLSSIAKVKNVEEYIATIDDPNMLDAIAFVVKNQKDKRVQQLMLEIS